MRVILSGCAFLALVACEPAIPDSGAGVGFDNAVMNQQAQQNRDAQLQGAALPPAQAVSEETLGEQTLAALDARQGQSGETPQVDENGVVQASPTNPAERRPSAATITTMTSRIALVTLF